MDHRNDRTAAANAANRERHRLRRLRRGCNDPRLLRLGDALRTLRERKGLSQWELAVRLSEARGKQVWQGDVSMVEGGTRNLTWARLLDFLDCLGCTPRQLAALLEGE